MIKANELRIGNYILFKQFGKGKGKIGQMKAGDFGRVTCDDPESSEYHPIPLTPEWLERYGQKCTNANGWDYQIQVGALKWYFRWNTEWYSEIGGIYIDSRVRYVHELQNLYFAISGKELPITPPQS